MYMQQWNYAIEIFFKKQSLSLIFWSDKWGYAFKSHANGSIRKTSAFFAAFNLPCVICLLETASLLPWVGTLTKLKWLFLKGNFR